MFLIFIFQISIGRLLAISPNRTNKSLPCWLYCQIKLTVLAVLAISPNKLTSPCQLEQLTSWLLKFENMNKKYSIREECKYGHPIAEGDSCQLGHPKILMMILDCAHQLCFFHTKPSYYVSSVEKQTIEDQLKQTIEDHFISAHGLKHENELAPESQKEDTEETTGAVTDEIKSADYMTKIKKMASRICVLGHKVGESQDRCVEGHIRAFTLDCEVHGCSYVTEPIDKKFISESIDLMKIHLSAAHSLNIERESKYKDKGKEVSKDPNKKYDPNKQKTCPSCYKIFYNKSNMKRHIKREHDRIDRFNCCECTRSFATDYALNYHKMRMHQSSDFKCPKCSIIISDFKSYCDHLKQHTSRKEFKCKDCAAVIKGKDNFKRHNTEVHDIEDKLNLNMVEVPVYLYQCDECQFKSKRKYDLKIHKEHKHSPGVTIIFACGYCSKTFSYKSSLNFHIKKIHTEVEKTQ